MIIRRINPVKTIPDVNNLLKFTAAEDIPAGSVVVKEKDDLAYCADIHNETHMYRTVGIAIEKAGIGETVYVQAERPLMLDNWSFEFKKPVYCGDYGVPTQTQPTEGFSQMVGIPYEEKTLYVKIDPAMVLSEFFVLPTVVITSDFEMISRFRWVTFTNTNINYVKIEWRVLGDSPVIDGNTTVGEDLNTLKVKWNTTGKKGVKIRLMNKTSGLWSNWSYIFTIDVV